MDTKACTGCGKELPMTSEYFYWQKIKRLKAGGRWASRCKTCTLSQQAGYYDENTEKIKARVRNYSAENADAISAKRKESYAANPEPTKARAKKWREDNPERKKQADKDYRAAHPELDKEYSKRYRERHPERRRKTCSDYRKRNPDKGAAYAREYNRRNPHISRAIKLRRRARESELPNTFTAHDWQVALDHFDHKCAACGRPVGLWHTLAADHWIPVTKGGGSTPDNIVPLCHGVDGCNNSKGNKDAKIWLIERFGKRKSLAILKHIEEYLKGS